MIRIDCKGDRGLPAYRLPVYRLDEAVRTLVGNTPSRKLAREVVPGDIMLGRGLVTGITPLDAQAQADEIFGRRNAA